MTGSTCLPPTGPHPSPEMLQAAEKRLERWLLSDDLRDYMRHSKDIRRPSKTGAYISISRQAGAGGLSIARVVGKLLNWDVLDKELLDFMADRYNLPRDMLQVVDETKHNWFFDVLGAFLDSRLVSHDKFVFHLERIMYLAALYGNVVFVGRGAQFALPRDNGLAVRIIKPRKLRVERFMELRGIGQAEAAALVDQLDKDRRDFCQRHFHHDLDNHEEYDVVINTARLSDETAAEVIVNTFRLALRDNVIRETRHPHPGSARLPVLQKPDEL